MLDDEALGALFGGARPGLSLIAVEDAAIPVSLVQTDVLAQERKPLSLLNEFVLRFSEAGVTSIDEIAALCGIEPALIESAVADELAAGNVAYTRGRRTVTLTPVGIETWRALETVRPVQAQLSVAFDRLSWTVAGYARSDLIPKKEAQERGMIVLPAARTSRIGLDDVTVPALNALLRGADKGQRGRFEVLAIRRLSANVHRYLPAKLLVYGDATRDEVEASLVVNDETSMRHDIALAELGGAASLGISVAPPDERPVLTPELEALRIPTAPPGGDVDDAPAAPVAEPRPATDGAGGHADTGVRGISVFEHPKLLEEALNEARDRLLLIAPWVRSAVVTTDFLARLEQRLRAGCRVHIAHGIGADDQGSDEEALRRLENLRVRFPEKFVLARLANSHAKILIFDGIWVTTSFNWLSFKGDPERTYRMEEGTLVRIPRVVDAHYSRYVALIEEQRVR